MSTVEGKVNYWACKNGRETAHGSKLTKQVNHRLQLAEPSWGASLAEYVIMFSFALTNGVS